MGFFAYISGWIIPLRKKESIYFDVAVSPKNLLFVSFILFVFYTATLVKPDNYATIFA